jgi:glycopeptide antibiotics resistance protein
MTPRRRYIVARAAYVAVILLATLTHLDFSWDLAAAAQRVPRALLPSMGWRDAVDGLRNIALFAGFGAVWVVTSISGKVDREIVRATLVGLALSATVEGLQLFSSTRTASVVDVSTNTFGALAGAVVLVLLIAKVQRSRTARSYLGLPMVLLAGAYVLAVLCEAVVPLFNSEPLAWSEGGPLAALRLALQSATPLSLGEVPLFDLLLFAPAGFLVVMALGELGQDSRQSWLKVAGVGTGLMFASELLHGMIRLPIHWEAAATNAAALTLGAWAARNWLAPLTQALRGPARARWAIFGYAILLVFWGWRPLLPETDFRLIAAQLTLEHFEPLQGLAERVDVFSATHVAQQFLLYVPLGGMLAVWPLRLDGRWSHLWPALWLAAAIELGHVVIVGRTFDVTNALLACSGLGIGWIVVRRSGFRPYGAALPARP